SSISESNIHTHDDLPLVLAGTAKGRIAGNRHLAYPKETPLNNLFLSMFDLAGVPHVDAFGDSTRRLTQLEMARGALGRTLSASAAFALALVALMLPAHAQPRDERILDAVKRRDQKAFDSLLRAKADVNARQPDGATALAWAVHLGERRMAE